ncbi:MAG: hypothetical protein ACLTBV_04190 [Enterocloster bolteae]
MSDFENLLRLGKIRGQCGSGNYLSDVPAIAGKECLGLRCI